MPLSQELPDFSFVPRAVGAGFVQINERALRASFLLAPDRLIEAWKPSQPLCATDLAAVLALDPELVLLGTGERQRFPAAEVLAACLTRGVGIDVMDNAAAARTFNVLAAEGRRVVAAFLLP